MPMCDFNKVAKHFIEIARWHGCSPVNLLHVFKAPFPENNSAGLFLEVATVTSHTLNSSTENTLHKSADKFLMRLLSLELKHTKNNFWKEFG